MIRGSEGFFSFFPNSVSGSGGRIFVCMGNSPFELARSLRPGHGPGFEGRSNRVERLPKKRPLRILAHAFAEKIPEEKKANDKRIPRELVNVALRNSGQGIKELQAGRISVRALHGFSSGLVFSS